MKPSGTNEIPKCAAELVCRTGLPRVYARKFLETISRTCRNELDRSEFEEKERDLRDNCLVPGQPFDNQPIALVSWMDAVRYCNWLTKKSDLPGNHPSYIFEKR